MVNREFQEEREYRLLTEFGTKARESRGRIHQEAQCTLRTDFQRDRDRIIHSKSFRRLMHKTQVFLAPEGDHYRTRLTHTIEVSQIARTIARGLGVNEDLTEAIAMGHDLGHTPFGHSGEAVLNRIHAGGFKHNEQSLRVVDYLENGKKRRGMNLTAEVRDGILNHTGGTVPFTIEGQIVRTSDRIAYINHDIDDALRSGIISFSDLPEGPLAVLGQTHGDRIDTLVNDMISNSWGKFQASLTSEKREAMNELRTFMFQNVYLHPQVKKVEDLHKVEVVIESLYDYFLQHPEQLPPEYDVLIEKFGVAELVKDYIAGMTDRYALTTYETIKGNK